MSPQFALVLLALLASALSARAITSVSVSAPSSAQVNSGYSVDADGSDDYGEIEDLTVTRNGQYFDSIYNDMGMYDYSISLSGSDTAPSSTGTVSYGATLDTNSTSAYDSTSVSIVDTMAPSVPSSLMATSVTLTSFTLTWGASTDNVGVTAYEVMRDSTSLGTTSGTSLAITNLSMNTTYAMKVRARDAAGNWSAWSTVFNVTTTNWVNAAVFISQTINGASNPSSLTLNAGQGVSAVVTMKNTGSKPWTTDSTPHRLGSQAPQDNHTWGPSRAPLPSSPINPSGSAAFTFTITAPTAPGAYTFQWRMVEEAVTWFGDLSPAVTITVNDTTAPSVPSGLSGSGVGVTAFTLNWSASSDNVGVTAYEVIRDSTSLGTTSGTSMSVSGLLGDTTYAMQVRARDAADNWSAWSAVDNVTTLVDPVAPTVSFQILDGSKHALPVNGNGRAQAGPNSTIYIRVSGTDSAGSLGMLYSRIDYPDSTILSWQNVTVSGGSASHDFGPYTIGTIMGVYNVWAHAQDAAAGAYQWSGNGWQGEQLPDLEVADTTVPSVPTGLSSSSVTSVSFALSWSASTDNIGVTAYEVMQDSTSLGATTGLSKSITGLSAGTTYGMKVRARDAAGNWSAWSSVLYVTTAASTADDDNDGLTNGEEQALGTDPETAATAGNLHLKVQEPQN